ncbi:Cullin-associated NEDD8-dissociated protein 1 N-terminal part [Penicillium sp. IBT 18751x]|nr:Cullin-associated NEDD8-dissociated protein 1 N-terminal part [Penicillium sp. IBT 18751x]
MGDRHITQQSIFTLLGKLDDPDADLRYMSLNDLFNILNSPNSSFLSGDERSATKLADGLLKALDDQHGDVQNQALKCLGPLALRLPFNALMPLLEKLTNLTSSQTLDTSVPNTALRTIVDTLPRPQAGQPATPSAVTAYNAVSKVLIPRLVGPTQSSSGRRGSVVRGMLEKDPAKGFSSDAIDVLIKVVTCFGPLLQEHELAALTEPVMAIIHNDTAGTVVTKRALAGISGLVLFYSDSQLNAFVKRLADTLASPEISTVHRRHLIAAIGTIARSAPVKFGPHLNSLVPFVFSAVGEEGVTAH